MKRSRAMPEPAIIVDAGELFRRADQFNRLALDIAPLSAEVSQQDDLFAAIGDRSIAAAGAAFTEDWSKSFSHLADRLDDICDKLLVTGSAYLAFDALLAEAFT